MSHLPHEMVLKVYLGSSCSTQHRILYLTPDFLESTDSRLKGEIALCWTGGSVLNFTQGFQIYCLFSQKEFQEEMKSEEKQRV